MSENRSRFVLLCQQALVCAVVAAVAAPAIGVADLDLVGPPAAERPAGDRSDHRSGSLVAAAPVRPTLDEVPILAAGAAEAPGAVPRRRGDQALASRPTPDRVGRAGERVISSPQEVDGYASIGVTWGTGTRLEDDEITVKVRTLDDGEWSSWQEVAYDADHGPDPGSDEARNVRDGTDAVVVGDVDDVQVKAVTPDGALPDDLRLSIVNPGGPDGAGDPGDPDGMVVEEPAIDTARLASARVSGVTPTATPTPAPTGSPTADPTADPTAGPTGEPTGEPTGDPTGDPIELTGTPAAVTPKPKIYSRAQWGADERMRDKRSLTYFEVHAGFVHHTVNANGYTRAQVPSIIRGIYAYHTRSRGWSDIGYNFLVDRFGRIWEGRYGGVDRPVVGAHTLGYNESSFAMSAIGNFETARPGSAMLDAYGRLFAWKLSLHGVDAASRNQSVAGRRMPAINGHRDAGQTACPGRFLYAKIGLIRDKAAAYQRSFSTRDRDTDLSGSRWPDLVVRERGSQQAYVVRTGGQLDFTGAGRAASRWASKDLVAAPGDLTGDGAPDMLARSGRTGNARIYPGDGSGGFGAPTERVFTQFHKLDQLAAVGDLDGDGYDDVAGRVADSRRLYLFPGRAEGRFGSALLLSPDWDGLGLTAGVGDLDGDGHPDLVARDRAGAAWLFPGTGRARLGTKVPLAASWGGYDVITGRGDLTGDKLADIVVRARRSQKTFVYPGDGHGGIGHRLGPFEQFDGVDFLAAAGDVTGTGGNDLVGRNARGHLVVWANNGRRNIARVVDTGDRFGNTNLVLNVGDWDGDGHGDVMARRTSNGDLVLYRGTKGRGFEAPVRAGTGWNSVELVTAVGDITGDGFPDLMAQPRDRAMRIYPGNGATGFRRSYVAHSSINGTKHVGVGLWNGDGSPDTLVRRSEGKLVRYPGNGPGGLTNPHVVGSRANRYDWMVGAGDVDGDGRSDVVARDGKGRLWLLPGTSSGLAPRRFIAAGFERYDLAG